MFSSGSSEQVTLSEVSAKELQSEQKNWLGCKRFLQKCGNTFGLPSFAINEKVYLCFIFVVEYGFWWKTDLLALQHNEHCGWCEKKNFHFVVQRQRQRQRERAGFCDSRVCLIHLFLALNFYCHFYFYLSCQIHFRFLFNGFSNFFFFLLSYFRFRPLTMPGLKTTSNPNRRTKMQTTHNCRLAVKYFTFFASVSALSFFALCVAFKSFYISHPTQSDERTL